MTSSTSRSPSPSPIRKLKVDSNSIASRPAGTTTTKWNRLLSPHNDLRLIAVTTVATWTISIIILNVIARFVAPFDTSHLIGHEYKHGQPVAYPRLRWDAIHFLSVAKEGYTYEQQLAFQPGWHGILRLSGMAARGSWTGVTTEDIMRGSLVLQLLCRVATNLGLYTLTKDMFGSRRLALVTSLLYAFPPTPAVMCAPYTEQLYAATTFAAMVATGRRRYFVAALLFAVATSTRATGVFSSAILAWGVLFGDCQTWDQFRRRSIFAWLIRLSHAASMAAIVCLPFVAFQVYSYCTLCRPVPSRPWCNLKLPFVYSWVQKEYWNIGLFNYWTLAQLPNFLIAAPVILLSLKGSVSYLASWLRSMSRMPPSSLLPAIYLHHLGLMVILIFASHTQITLRLASTDTVIWWTVAQSALAPMVQQEQEMEGHRDRLEPGPLQRSEPGLDQVEQSYQMGRIARIWIWWSIIWGMASLALWAGHYPPA